MCVRTWSLRTLACAPQLRKLKVRTPLETLRDHLKPYPTLLPAPVCSQRSREALTFWEIRRGALVGSRRGSAFAAVFIDQTLSKKAAPRRRARQLFPPVIEREREKKRAKRRSGALRARRFPDPPLCGHGLLRKRAGSGGAAPGPPLLSEL